MQQCRLLQPCFPAWRRPPPSRTSAATLLQASHLLFSRKPPPLRNSTSATTSCPHFRLPCSLFQGDFLFSGSISRSEDSHRLKVLDLGHNYLTELPNEIANLGELIHLRLSNNQLPAILPALGQLQCLQVLLCSSHTLHCLDIVCTGVGHQQQSSCLLPWGNPFPAPESSNS